MKKYICSILILFLLFSCSVTRNSISTIRTIETDSKEIIILFNGQAYPWEIAEDNLSVPYTVTYNEIGFVTSNDTLSFDLYPKDSVKINFVINTKDTIQIIVIGQSKTVEFNEKYIENNNGKYKVFSPRVHELVNISIALTNIGKQDSNMVYMESIYYNSVIEYFDKFKAHPLIDSLNRNITETFGESTYNYYYNIRMNACMYSYDENHIVNNSPYNRLGFGGENYLKNLIPLLEDFSETSDFNEFYNANEEYYRSLINSYHDLVPINKMWKWVEERFSQKYESYIVYFSPLIGGAHSTQKLFDNEFKETIMFINAPIFNEKDSLLEKEAILSRVVFTEIDHNYVNPTTDKFPELSSLLQPLDCWNNGAQGYGNGYATFNEYMTWAVFTLYLYDNFDEKVFENRNKIETDFMVDERGFIKYKEFNEFVLNWYMKNPNEPLEKIYPKVIEWIKLEACE